MIFPVSYFEKVVVWVFPTYAWYGLEKVFPITRICPKFESDWAKTMIWPCGFKSSGIWRSVIKFFPTFRKSAVPSSTRATPSDMKKTNGHTKKTWTSATPPSKHQIWQLLICTFPPVWISLKRNCNFQYGFFLSISNDTSLGPARVIVLP